MGDPMIHRMFRVGRSDLPRLRSMLGDGDLLLGPSP